MKFIDILNEKFFKGAKVYGKYMEIYTNPTKSEITTILKDSKFKEIRGAIDKKDNMYVWSAEKAEHARAKEVIKKDFYWIFIYYKNSNSIEMYELDDKPAKRDKVVKKLKQLFGNNVDIP